MSGQPSGSGFVLNMCHGHQVLQHWCPPLDPPHVLQNPEVPGCRVLLAGPAPRLTLCMRCSALTSTLAATTGLLSTTACFR